MGAQCCNAKETHALFAALRHTVFAIAIKTPSPGCHCRGRRRRPVEKSTKKEECKQTVFICFAPFAKSR
jgi:hypothetical protein